MFPYERSGRPEGSIKRGTIYPVDDVIKTAETGDALKFDIPDDKWPTFYRLLGWNVRSRGFRLRTRCIGTARYCWVEARPGGTAK
jgi:hypothetical protein